MTDTRKRPVKRAPGPTLSQKRQKEVLKALSKENVAGLAGPHQFNDVVDSARLVEVTLVGCSFNVAPEFHNETNEKEFSVGFAEQPELTFEPDPGLAVGIFRWEVRVAHKTKTILEIEAKYLVVYDQLQQKADGAVRAFMLQHGKLMTYPYFRTFVAQLSWAGAVNLPVLPVLRI
jgi:hypothetical protein